MAQPAWKEQTEEQKNKMGKENPQGKDLSKEGKTAEDKSKEKQSFNNETPMQSSSVRDLNEKRGNASKQAEEEDEEEVTRSTASRPEKADNYNQERHAKENPAR